MQNVLDKFISDFMEFGEYDKMCNDYETKEYAEIKEKYLDIMDKTILVLEKEKLFDKKEFETISINYVSETERLGVLVGVKYAFELFIDLSKKETSNL